MADLMQVLEELPDELRDEVGDFAEFLLARSRNRTRTAPKLEWAGALAGKDAGLSSVEIQHQLAWLRDSQN